jgi:hypothetical protein
MLFQIWHQFHLDDMQKEKEKAKDPFFNQNRSSRQPWAFSKLSALTTLSNFLVYNYPSVYSMCFDFFLYLFFRKDVFC